MKSNLFFGCTSSDEVQLRFDELSRIFKDHDEMLQSLKTEYSVLMTALNPPKPSEPVKNEAVSISDVIRCLQEKINPEGIRLEIVGKWLWLSGTTFGAKEILKQLGFRYSPDKKSWYWRSEEDRSSNEKPIPLDMIREKFGSQQVDLR